MPEDQAGYANPRRSGVSRRALITGAGAGAALLTAGGLGAPAQAAPAVPGGDGVARRPDKARSPDSSPVTSTIGSAPIDGYIYRTICMYDFRPFDPNGQLTWGGYGTYSAGTATPIRATVEVPPGALLRDIEWYLYNNSGASISPDAYLYAAGNGIVFPIGASVLVPSGSGINAWRATVAQQGPYPLGSRLLASVTGPVNGTVQVNGARFGFTQGVGATGLLPTPVRTYDSRSTGGRFHAGQTRTITLPASIVGPGVTGVLANITATGASRSGFLKVYPASGSAPSASALNFGGGSIANALTVGVSSSRQIKVYASQAVHVIVDVSGTVS